MILLAINFNVVGKLTKLQLRQINTNEAVRILHLQLKRMSSF